MSDLNFHGVMPAIVTPFSTDGSLDEDSLASYSKWLAGVRGVTGLVVNGHAGEGSSLTQRERAEVIRIVAEAADGDAPVIAGVVGDGSRVIAEEAELAAASGADAVLVFPAPSWLRFGYQAGAPAERYRAVYAAAGLEMILFQFPDATQASYNLATILELCALDGVVAIKDGTRNMIRWDTEVPVVRSHFPEMPILTCQDEFLLHTMWEADGALVGYGALVPELMVELLEKAQSHNYDEAKATYDRMADLTRVIYHRASHIESTIAMKLGLVQRGLIATATVRPPLMSLAEDVSAEVAAALSTAGVETYAAVKN